MSKTKPLVPGKNGRDKPSSGVKRSFLPAAYRLMFEASPGEPPAWSSSGFWPIHLLREHIDPDVPLDDTVENPTDAMRNFWEWLKGAPAARAWLTSSTAFIRMHPFDGWWDLVPRERVPPHPYEICNLRLPRTLVNNRNVMALQAWCQGMYVDQIRDFMPDEERPIAEMVATGLEEFVEDPYVRWLYAHQGMKPFVLGFSAGPHRVMERMEGLLYDPMSATSGELEVILASPQFAVAEAAAAGRRWSWFALREDKQAFPELKPYAHRQHRWTQRHRICRTANMGLGNKRNPDTKMNEYMRTRKEQS